MRILKGWTNEEQKELEEAKDNAFNSAIELIRGIFEDGDHCKALTGKYIDQDTDEDNQLAKDIVDFYIGTAKFPKELYVVHDKVTDRYVCFNTLEETFCWSQLRIPETNTKEEWLTINPAYEPMLEMVED